MLDEVLRIAEEEAQGKKDFWGILEEIIQEEGADLYTQIELIAAEEMPHKKLMRLMQCRTWQFCPGDPHTGGGYWYQYECNVTECEFCRRKKAQGIKSSLEEAATNKRVRREIVSPEEDKNFSRRLNAAKVLYVRCPHISGNVHFFQVGEDPCIQGQDIDLSSMTEDDWTELLWTAPGKNVSSSIKKHSPPSPQKQDQDQEGRKRKIVVCTTMGFSKKPGQREDDRKREIDLLWDMAVLETAGLDPDLDTVADCLTARRETFEKNLKTAGYRVTFSVYRKIWVYENRIDWKPNNAAIQKKLHNAGIYAPGEVGSFPDSYLGEGAENLNQLVQDLKFVAPF